MNVLFFFLLHVSACVVCVCGICVYVHVLMWMGTHQCECVWRLELTAGVFFKCSPPYAVEAHVSPELVSFSSCTYTDCSNPGITGGPQHPHSIYMRAGDHSPRSHICMSSTLTTEPPFQPYLSSFNIICQIIQITYSCRMMTNHLIITVPLENCISKSWIHGHTWLCHTSNIPMWTESRLPSLLPGTLSDPSQD